jgi:hypothetical protein
VKLCFTITGSEYQALKVVSAGPKQKPALEEGAFQQLLAAAYVVQEHNDSLRGSSLLETPQVLSAIAEIQSAVRDGALDAGATARLVAERLLKLLGASGISISLVSDGYLDCVAESGTPAAVPGSSIASHSLVATERLKSGEIFDSADAHTDIRLGADLCRELDVASLVAAPILRFGQIAGLIEARWSCANAFDEAAISACRLMAGLVTGMLEQPALSLLPQTSPEKPIFVPVRKIEEQRNNHANEARSNEGSNEIEIKKEIQTSSDTSTTSFASTVTTGSVAPANAPAESCRVCGHLLRADEAFCGHCSMPRMAATPSDELQSKWASLWFIQKAQGTFAEEPEKPAFRQSQSSLETVASSQSTDSPSSQPPRVAAKVSDRVSTADHFSYFKPTAQEYSTTRIELLEDEEPSLRETWSHAVEAARNKLHVRDVVLALVVAVLTFGVVSAWPSSSGKLTWFGSTMVRLGLAQAPTHSPVYGNPDANVWVDVHSGLYYCEGADLYGETPEGQFISQRKAQQRNFEPASGLACQ